MWKHLEGAIPHYTRGGVLDGGVHTSAAVSDVPRPAVHRSAFGQELLGAGGRAARDAVHASASIRNGRCSSRCHASIDSRIRWASSRRIACSKPYYPKLQLALAGGTADDDPEGAEVLREVTEQAGDDNDIKVLLLPPDAHRVINALQRSAVIILQKSLKEGFGLTVTEGLWKAKPVIGGACGGITIQVHDYQTGFLVHSPAGAAYRIRYLLRYADKRQRMGRDRARLRARALPAHPPPA